MRIGQTGLQRWFLIARHANREDCLKLRRVRKECVPALNRHVCGDLDRTRSPWKAYDASRQATGLVHVEGCVVFHLGWAFESTYFDLRKCARPDVSPERRRMLRQEARERAL